MQGPLRHNPRGFGVRARVRGDPYHRSPVTGAYLLLWGLEDGSMPSFTSAGNRFAAACLAGCCGCCCAPATAWAVPPTAETRVDEHRPASASHPPHHLIGVKGVQVDEFHHGRTEGGIGFGAFFEETVVEGWLDLETSVVVEWIDGRICAPLEVVVKKPFHIDDYLTPFVGLGPSVTVFESYVDHEDGHYQSTIARVGLTFVMGSYVWPSDHWGFDVEVDYNLMLTHGVRHELTVALGPVYRF